MSTHDSLYKYFAESTYLFNFLGFIEIVRIYFIYVNNYIITTCYGERTFCYRLKEIKIISNCFQNSRKSNMILYI